MEIVPYELHIPKLISIPGAEHLLRKMHGPYQRPLQIPDDYDWRRNTHPGIMKAFLVNFLRRVIVDYLERGEPMPTLEQLDALFTGAGCESFSSLMDWTGVSFKTFQFQGQLSAGLRRVHPGFFHDQP